MEESLIQTEEIDKTEQSINPPVLTKEQLRLDRKKQRKARREYKKTSEYKRSKIDKLLAKQNIKFRGPFSYRTVRIFAYIFMLFAQIYLVYSIASKIVTPAHWVGSFVNVLEILSIFALPLFLTSNFCLIMSSKRNIKNFLIFYSAFALLIYLAIILIHYRYIGGFANIISDGDAEMANGIANTITNIFFGKVINYNIFVDLSLFSFFYFFFFYKPKKIKTRKSLITFRLFSLLPVSIAIVSSVLYAMHFLGSIKLPVAALAIMPCRSFTIYAIFFILAIVIKIRQYRFFKLGGTEIEYEEYLKSNRNSLEVSVIASIIIFAISLIDFILLFTIPEVILLGIGVNFYFVFIIPFVLLLSYTRKPKLKIMDAILPIIFVVLTIIIYLEAFLLVFNSL